MKNKLLTATGPELSQLLGEVLQPEKTEHIWEGGAIPGYKCCKCKTIYDTLAEFEADECTVSDPIPLTPAEAFKWRDWAVEKYGEDSFVNALIEVYNDTVNNITFLQFIAKARPHVWLIAAALCKENEDE